MRNKISERTLFIVSVVLFSVACNRVVVNDNYKLTESEKKICDTLKIDTTIIADIRTLNHNKIEPFHYSLSKMFKDGKTTEIDPIYLQGLVFTEQNEKSYDLVFKLRNSFKNKGYTIFLLENNFNIDKQPDYIGVLKTTDQFVVLKQVGTDGINYDMDTDSLISVMKFFDKKYELELIGASGEWCEFIIGKEPASWEEFAKEVYKVCPDVVDQGTGSVEALATEMERTKRLYFWWD